MSQASRAVIDCDQTTVHARRSIWQYGMAKSLGSTAIPAYRMPNRNHVSPTLEVSTEKKSLKILPHNESNPALRKFLGKKVCSI